MESKEHIRHLFNKYLDNKYSQEDLDALLHYFKVADSEHDLKELIESELYNSTDFKPYEEEINKVDQSVRDSLYQIITPAQKRIIPYVKIATAIAAVLVLVFTTIYFNRNLPENKLVISDAAQDIPPGTNRATLTLDNGESIVLREDKQGINIGGDDITYTDGTSLTGSDKTQYATLTVPRAGQYQVTLSDGTKVWLNAQTTFKYPVNFKGAERKVEIQGEAYFEVAHNENSPFVVRTSEQTVKVLGTAFNVNTYDGHVATTLINGRVQLSNLMQMTKILLPGQRAIGRRDGFDVRYVSTERYVAWKDGLIVLDKQDVHDILTQLERWYDVEFVNITSIDSKAVLSGEIPRDINLSGILQALEQQIHVKFEIEGRRIMISK